MDSQTALRLQSTDVALLAEPVMRKSTSVEKEVRLSEYNTFRTTVAQLEHVNFRSPLLYTLLLVRTQEGDVFGE